MTRRVRGIRIIQLQRISLVILSGIPLLLFAYMGQFSRLLVDDYTHVRRGLELGPWAGMLHWRNVWNGSYSHYILHGLVAPLDTAVPRVFPTVIIAAWLLGLFWLIANILNRVQERRDRVAWSFIMSACAVTASINALSTQESFLWYSASTRYSLPLTLFILYLALVTATMSQQRRRSRLLMAGIAGFAICFFAAGLAETYLVFQLSMLSCLLVLAAVIALRTGQRGYFQLIAAGCAATCLSAAVHVTAPGFHIRAATLSRIFGSSAHSLPDLFARTAELTFQYLGRQEPFAGFMMLFGIGLCAALLIEDYVPVRSGVALAGLAKQPLWLGLIVQLLFIAILWTHTSDDPQVLGRFSRAFFTVVSLNWAFVAFFLILIWQRRRVEELLQNSQKGYLFLSGAILLVVLVMFAATQFRSIHFKAVAYLFASSMVLLGILAGQLALILSDSRATTFVLVAGLSLAMTVVSLGVLFAAGLIGGHLVARIMAPTAFMQVIPGLIWGACVGYLIRRTCLATPADSRRLQMMGLSSLLLAIAIGAGIVLGHAKLVPDLSLYAREWDQRHQLILSLRDSGLTEVEVAPLSFDLSYYLMHQDLSTEPEQSLAETYYGLTSIAVSGKQG